MSSRVLNALKGVKEKITRNYSTEQLINTLDELLMRSIQGIVECSEFLDHRLITVSSWYSTNQRRKLSHLEKGQFIASSMAFLLADQRAKMRIYRRMGVERNLSITLIFQWLELAGECVTLEIQQLHMPRTEVQDRINHIRRVLSINNPHALFSSYQTVNYYVKQALQFREQISEKYMRHVVLAVVHYCKEQEEKNGPRMNKSDVAQNFMLAVYRAIDKCDINKGTLTSYVDVWIKNAKTTNVFRDETGVAYSIPSGQRKQLATKVSSMSNFAISIDDEEVKGIQSDYNQEEVRIRQDTIDHVRRLSKAVDPHGYGRIMLGITETLSLQEVMQLSTASVQQLGTQGSEQSKPSLGA